MRDHRLPKRVMSGKLDNVKQCGPGWKKKERMDCVAGERRVFGITGDWSTAALDPGVRYSTVCKGCCRFMAAWMRGEEKAPKNRQRKK